MNHHTPKPMRGVVHHAPPPSAVPGTGAMRGETLPGAPHTPWAGCPGVWGDAADWTRAVSGASGRPTISGSVTQVGQVSHSPADLVCSGYTTVCMWSDAPPRVSPPHPMIGPTTASGCAGFFFGNRGGQLWHAGERCISCPPPLIDSDPTRAVNRHPLWSLVLHSCALQGGVCGLRDQTPCWVGRRRTTGLDQRTPLTRAPHRRVDIEHPTP